MKLTSESLDLHLITLDDEIVRVATEASNDQIDAFTRSLSADFAAAYCAIPPAWTLGEMRKDRHFGD